MLVHYGQRRMVTGYCIVLIPLSLPSLLPPFLPLSSTPSLAPSLPLSSSPPPLPSLSAFLLLLPPSLLSLSIFYR